MKTKTDVLIIGGGIAGVSTLYHLTKMGWSDVMLTEKLELTSGSTWHAAGNLPHFSNSYNVMKLQQYSIALYARLQEETGQPVDHHMTGAVRLAHTQDRMDEFERVVAMSELAGLELEMIDNDRLKELYPFLDTTGLLGGLWDPADGHIDPTSVTNAMAAGARAGGATIVRNNPVSAVEQTPDRRWKVTTAKGVIDARIIVNAGGFRANEIAEMIGHRLPMNSMEHQFVVTDNIPALEERDTMVPMLRDPDVSYYLRQEGKGMILGPYEKGGIPWATDGVPKAFGQELLQPDLDRIEEIMCTAMEQVDILTQAGIKTVVNGPITYTPDGHPLIGPVHGYENYFVCTGFNFGIVQGGGAGHFMAQWIVNGHPELDLWELDPRRFGDYADNDFCVAKGTEVYANEYQLGFPHEYAMRPAVRGQKKAPVYERHADKNAVFGAYFGWERPAWFAPEGMEPKERHSFRRGNWFEPVAAECLNVQNNVGVLDLSPFTKFEVSGPGAHAYLESISPNRIPLEAGGVALAHPLTQDGGVAWEFSVTRLESGDYYLMAPAVAELMIEDWLTQRLPKDDSVKLTNTTQQWGTLVLAGPQARKVLSQLTDADLSNDGFPWFSGQEISVAGIKLRALRMNFVGELGWELHHPIEHQLALYDALMEAGQAYSISDFGMRALDSMRLEKGYPMWGHDLTHEFTLLESNLGFFAKLDKGEFEGRDALKQQKQDGVKQKMVLLEVDSTDVDAIHMEPVYQGDKLVGQVASGGYGHRVQKSLALAYVDVEALAAQAQSELSVKVLGKTYPVKVTKGCVYDAKGERLKSNN
ncbi:FAD-dependent oxidoreductase [Motiliproteus coralliicola]|uniref:FAD-dependent oxidoreductase n=1 Tax=Motiliproteus coralliicola TaxID=2283196 RepID=A0A369WIX7_9GAMM|nr:FAD-dependent oxidoreductase [Motiliproteus coralliicola]RDE19375.1 FAD-dependent oxidoreductase [Motiliproteus coralliicola]